MTVTAPHELTRSRREALQAAAQWYACLCSEEAGPADEQALQQWLDSDPMHQWAWQRVDQLQARLGRVPGHLALNTLERAEQHVSMSRRSVLKGLALVLGTGTLGVTAYRHVPVEHWLADHHTATGEVKQLTLEDGTRLILNTASAVDIHFTANERLVILRAGEVMVTTASDSAENPRPFVVQTPQGRVRAQGTRFSVRMMEGETQVAVFEHSVEVTTRTGSQNLCPAGQQLTFTADTASPPTGLAPTDDAWTRQMLVVQNMPLDAFLAELGRYRTGVLRCAPSVAHFRITGAFRVDDTDQALHALSKSFPVSVNFRTRYWVAVDEKK
ncbi:FecR domain-containing protein [Halomonas llamarensis]|uniref:FecR domain-containing protein n=1 Tax=Halomonas llamarensis TaxID=2945104 RepID=A0ABT0STB2_9GAMM|nr:FecR domain-containing protein [Halomonas llamarensis]MCL7931022.1 FecR domain-containing protein [Halomonas llamarensis]